MVKAKKLSEEERKRRSGVGKAVSLVMARDAHGHFYKKSVSASEPPKNTPIKPEAKPAPQGGLSGLLKKIFG